jgi:putative Ca2+/H+ antiporter (TMEM165/GDT1 family)
VRRLGTVTGLALRELWISFRLLLAVGVLVAAALPGALLPHTTPALAAVPLESPLEWFAIGLALALGVIGGMAAAALSRERRRGSAGWLVIRAVPRPVILLGWFAAFVVLLVAGLLPAATLMWLTVAAPVSEMGDPWPFAAPLIGALAAGVAAVAIGLLLGALLTPWPAGLLTLLLTAGLLLAAVLDVAPQLSAAPAPVAGLAILGDLPNQARPVADALRASGTALVVAAGALILAAAALGRADL